LTKVVMAQRHASGGVLASFGAQACLHDAWRGWRCVDAAA
jgi:hypothetical protein